MEEPLSSKENSVRALVVSFLAVVSSVVPAKAQGPAGSAGHAPVHVMVLGSFHMAGSTRNVVNSEAADVHSEEGRAGIDAVLDRLEAFAPDKIMVEVYPDRMKAFNERYAALLSGTYQPGLGESEQIGMQLAARLGHDRLYGIDYSVGLDYRPALALAEEVGQQRLLADLEAMNDELRAALPNERTVLERLIALNGDHPMHGNAYYLNVAQMGTVENPLGALQIADWWKRNLAIFARAAHYAEPGDTVLIVYGAGHKHQLERHFREARAFELVDPLEYLEPGS
ncbi:MAG: DUF5694 domain-containing protein [Longimicrobiales bacterium]|nr:DUF5694 domain-containing protein [Longimicrobiales bacterium]